MVANFKKAYQKEEEQEIIRKQEEQRKALEAENKVKKETQVQQGSASFIQKKNLNF